MRAILKGGFWNHLAPPKVGANNRISWNISTGVLIEWEKMRIRKNMGVFGKTRFLKNPWFRWKRRFPENAFFFQFFVRQVVFGKMWAFSGKRLFFLEHAHFFCNAVNPFITGPRIFLKRFFFSSNFLPPTCILKQKFPIDVHFRVLIKFTRFARILSYNPISIKAQTNKPAHLYTGCFTKK